MSKKLGIFEAFARGLGYMNELSKDIKIFITIQDRQLSANYHR